MSDYLPINPDEIVGEPVEDSDKVLVSFDEAPLHTSQCEVGTETGVGNGVPNAK